MRRVHHAIFTLREAVVRVVTKGSSVVPDRSLTFGG